MKRVLFLMSLFLLTIVTGGGGGKLWGQTANFTFSSSNAATTVDQISITGGTPGSNGYNASSTISVNATTGYTITGITFTFSSGTDASRYGGNVTVSSGTYTHEANSTTGSWSGNSNSVTFTPSGKFRITAMTVTYSSTSAAEYSYNIPIEDLRFEHQTYNPSRTGVLELNIETNGWQSYTNTSTTPYNYTLLLSTAGKTSNYIRVTAGSAILTKVVLVGADGAGTFHNCSSLGTDNYSTTDEDQIVWMKDGGATEATISFTATDQPQVSAIYVFTNTPLSTTKQYVTLRFAPASGTADANITDFQIDGRVKATIGGIDNGNFRPDDFTASSVSNSGSEASFNQFHISTGQVGVNTGSTAGTATVTAAFSGNQFYNAATSGTYDLTVNAATTTKTKTISINDMRISKTASTAGINASDNGLDRTLGGFAFAFGGAEGVKFNNGDFIILRNSGPGNQGTITITPQVSTGSVTINKVVVNMISGYTDGTVTATKPAGDISLSGQSSHTFDNVNASSFKLTSVSGNVYIQSFTIYYTESVEGALNDALITPTITFSKPSDAITPGNSYSSPTIVTSPKNFDIGLVSSNASVATVKTSGWTTAPLVALAGETGTATITASAAASTYYNAATAATYTVTYTDASAEKWDFRTLNVSNTINADDWTESGDYYNNKFTTSARFDVGNSGTYATTSHTTSQIDDLLFGRDNSNGLTAGQIRLHSSFMTFTNSAIIIAVPVSANDKVLVTFDGGSGTTQAGFDIGNAQVEGDASATSINSDDTQKTVTLVALANGYVTLKVNKSKVKLYRIQKSTETRGTLDLRDTSNSYERYVGTGTTASTDNHFSHRVKFTPSDGATTPVTYADDASKFHITSSDNSILDASGAYVVESSFGTSSSFYFANIIPKAAGTATLTITFDGNDDYKPNSYVSQTYTVYGPGEFRVVAEDQEIQQGQFSLINPTITDTDGNLIGIKLMDDGSGRYTTYILGEDENLPDYTEYFDFTFTPGAGTGDNYDKITMDGTIANKVLTEDNSGNAAAVGATRVITVTAIPKTSPNDYSTAFTTGASAVTTTATMTIIEKIKNPQIHLYWDAACTKPISENYTESSEEKWRIKAENATQAEDKQWVFNGTKFTSGFPNGRMIYAKVINPGDSIWFSYEQNAEASTIPANPTLNKAKRIFEYRRGIPIYIDDDLSGSDYVTLNIVATTWNASTRKRNLNGSVARIKFPKIIAHTRPAQPTYDPVSPDADASLNKDGRKIMNTSENVVAYGEGANPNETGPAAGNLVYGKFSTSTVYTTEQLINEKTVTYRIDNVPVVSTEVARRRFTSVQIKTESEGNDYISEQTYTEYWYLYDTDMRITPDRYDININSATTESPAYTVTWYNKKTGKNQEVDSYAGKISYSIGNTTADRNGATGATVDESTGIVTASATPGWVRVKITYSGGEQHGGVSGEPQYVSTTDESWAYYYVYITDPSTQQPAITPPTRNFTGTMSYTITAPNDWDVYYTIDGTTPAYETGTLLTRGNSVSNTIGESMSVDEYVTVKAIAYNPSNTSQTSVVVSETYTKRAAIPDPVFDPDGTKGNGYVYNTNDLIVQIACAYAGSVIYYTISDLGSGPYPDPVIGAANTYRYSGLSKVTVVGEKVIKAIAYDPVLEIYSNVVTSTYRYSSEMLKPYFQISKDGGQTWLGFPEVSPGVLTQNGTEWSAGQSWTISPTTQIRIIDPNPVAGTIYYTLDGTTKPSDDVTSMVYVEGYPFTVNRTTTGQAITILEDAASGVASAVFNVESAPGTSLNVWEANDETLTAVGDKHKMMPDDGFLIYTTNSPETIPQNGNSGTKVNKNSISGVGSQATKMYAQEHIVAMFGGFDHQPWEEMTIADRAIGAPIDNVGTYSIKSKDNAKMEAKYKKTPTETDNYNHVNSWEPETIHERTFRVPAKGTYVQFEPERDGDLTIWVLQQGAVHYEEDEYFIDRYIRVKPVYLVDEQGKSYKVKEVNGVPQLWSAARLTENWTKLQATQAADKWSDYTRENNTKGDYIYLRYSDGAVFDALPSGYTEANLASEKAEYLEDPTKLFKKMENKGPNKAESRVIYNLFDDYITKNHISVGDPIKPFAIHSGAALSLNNGQYVDDSNDGTGYVLASGGYAKYTFELKAGKTYYFMGVNTKIGIRGFQFIPTETATRPEVVITDGSTQSITKDGTEKTFAGLVSEEPVNVTFNRSFTADTWAALVLPFSVSTTQFEKAFGANAGIVHFNDIVGGKTIHLVRHRNQMLVAGTPVFIYPKKTISSIKFNGVHIEKSTVEEISGSATDNPYKMIGTYENLAEGLNKWDYYLTASGELSYLKSKDHASIKGTRAWLRSLNPEVASSRVLSVDFGGFIDEDDENTTGIINVKLQDDFTANSSSSNGNVYNLKGQKVSNGSLEGLAKGVYIINGKKMVVE